MHRVEPAECLVRLVVQPPPVVRPPAGARDVDVAEIHRGMALDDPLRERLPGPRAVDDPLRVEPRRDPQAGHLGELAQMEVRVGREALGGAQVVREPRVAVQDRQPLPERRQHRREVVPVLAELDEAAGPDVPRSPRLPLRLEGAEQEPSPVRADVEVRVQVAHDRQVVLGGGQLLGEHPHVLGRVERHGGARKPGELRRPQAGGQHRCLAGDRAGVGDHAHHPAAAQLEAGHGHPEDEGRTAVLRALREREGGVAGVHGAVGRGEGRSRQIVDLGGGPQGANLRRGEDLGLDRRVPRHRDAGVQLLHPCRACARPSARRRAGTRCRRRSPGGAPRTAAR